MKSRFLSYHDQYTNMESQGITFHHHSQKEVIEYLQYHHYYYRITSYKYLFPHYQGHFHHVDFQNLVDLAAIDDYLREGLLAMCLDIEQAVKTKFMTQMTSTAGVNPEEIMEDFARKHPHRYEAMIDQIQASHYKRELFNEEAPLSIWMFLEVIPFGGLLEILDDYTAQQYTNFRSDIYFDALENVRKIRNICAHNNVFLIHLYSQGAYEETPSQQLVSFAQNIGVDTQDMHYRKPRDVVAVFYLHQRLCVDEKNERRQNQFRMILERYYQHQEIHQGSKHYQRFGEHLKKCAQFL